MTNGRRGKLVASCSLEWNSSIVSVEFWEKETAGQRQPIATHFWARGLPPRPATWREPTHHQPQHQHAHTLPDLGRNVAAKLLQGAEETLQLAELPGPAGRGQVLCGQRSRA